MNGLLVGSLCSGYLGLDMAVHAVLGGQLAWVADSDPAAARVLEYRAPGVPNLGDIAAVDWTGVLPVDVLTAGFPCQDVSCAGARRGLRPGTRTGVWSQVADAISALQPSLVVLENVRGLLSADAESHMEHCPWCMGNGGNRSILRALGAVLGDLADLGFDAEWQNVRASDAGACHRRDRIFVLAWPAQNPDGSARDQRGIAASGQTPGRWSRADASGSSRASSPDSDCGGFAWSYPEGGGGELASFSFPL